MEKQKLIYVESKALFSPSEVSDKAIVFIKDTKEIWTHGVYFSCSGTWATPITLSLTGDTTGSVSIDGSGNASIATTTKYLSGMVSSSSDCNSTATKLPRNVTYYPCVLNGAANGFPTVNNANGILSLNVHDYSYTHLLGFSSDGNIYHRRRNGGTWETSWKTILNSSNYTNFHHTFASLTNKPTTLSGYGITDCIPIISGGKVTTDTDLSTLGMTTTGAKLSVFHLIEGPYPTWLNVPYMNVLMFRSTSDSYGAIGIEMMGSNTVLFIGGRNAETTTNNVPNWWFRIKGAPGTTYDLNSILNVVNNLSNYVTINTDQAITSYKIFKATAPADDREAVYYNIGLKLTSFGDNHKKVAAIGMGNEYQNWYKAAIGFERTGTYDRGDIVFLFNNITDKTTCAYSDIKVRINAAGNISTIGTASASGFKKTDSSDSYVLLGGGGHKLLSDLGTSHTHSYLPLSGGTMTGILTLTTDTAYIKDTQSGSAIFGTVSTSNTFTGISGLETIFAGRLTNMVLRTSGDNLYHYNHSKSARYLILDTNNYSSYTLPLSGGTMTGALNFANNTWNKVGDDAYMGDCNISGMIGIKGSNATPGFAMYNNGGTLLGKLYASGTSLYWSDAKILTSNDSIGEAYLAWGGRNLANNPGPIDAALAPSLGANRLAFLNPDAIDIKYSLDGGTTWVDYGVTDAQKVLLFDGNHLVDLYLGGDSTQDTSIDRTSWRLRITLSAIGYNLYGEFKKFMIRVTSHGNILRCTLLGRSYSNVQNNVDTWVTFLDTLLSGWPGWNTINHPTGIIIPNTNHYGQIRFDFYMTALGSFGVPSHIHKIMGFAPTCWTWPSIMAGYGSIYSYDWQLNVTFPAQVTATGFSGNLTGNATSANKLTTARTFWGQSFNGTANVNGLINMIRDSSFTNSYNEGIRIQGTSALWAGIFLGTDGTAAGYIASQWNLSKTASDTFRISRGATSSSLLEILNSGNVGIGTSSPSEKLLVAGNAIIGTDSAHGNITIKSKTLSGVAYLNFDNGYSAGGAHWQGYIAVSGWGDSSMKTEGYGLPGKDQVVHGMIFKLPRTDMGGYSFRNGSDQDIGYLGMTGLLTVKSGYIVSGGTSSQFLKADGSLDSSSYYKIGTELPIYRNVHVRDQSTGSGIFGVVNSGSDLVGGTDLETVYAGTSTLPFILRTSSDNLYHYNKAKATRYKILDSFNISSYALSLSGGTLGSSTASFTDLFIKSSTAKLRLTSFTDSTTYIQSGNSDFTGNATLKITGYNSNTGSNLYFSFANIYCRSGNYTNIDSGNYSNYALKVNGTNGTADGVSTLLNKLSTGTANPQDTDYYICQYAGGGTTNTTYHRRPTSALYSYIRAKLYNSTSNYFIMGNGDLLSKEDVYSIGSYTAVKNSYYANNTMYYYWYKIEFPESSSGSASATYSIMINDDNNYPRFSHYILNIKRYYANNIYGNSYQLTHLGGTSLNIMLWVANDSTPNLYILCPCAYGEYGLRIKCIYGTNKFNPTPIEYNNGGAASSFTIINKYLDLCSVRVDNTGVVTHTYGNIIKTDIVGNVTGTATSASKVANALTIQLNGGTTAGTNKFVYDGSSAYTINITPEAIGASATNHTHSYLPLAGGTLGNTSATETELRLKSSTTTLRLIAYLPSTTNYIQSGNSDFSGNANLNITGYNATTGSNLHFNFTNIYCRAGNYTNIDSGNYSSYALPLSGGTLTDTLISRDIRPSANLSYSLGTSSYYYNYVYANYFKKNGSSDSYVLLGGGGHKAVSDFAPNNVATLSSSGMGNSDLWTLVFEKSYPANYWYAPTTMFYIRSASAGCGILCFYNYWASGTQLDDYEKEVWFFGAGKSETGITFGGPNRDINDYFRIYIDKANFKYCMYYNRCNDLSLRILELLFFTVPEPGEYLSTGALRSSFFTNSTTVVDLPTESSTLVRVPIKTTYNHDRTIKTTKSIYASSFYENSDIRLKENVRGIDLSDLTKLVDLVQFNFKDSGTKKYGVIAQLLELVGLQNLVYENDGKKAVDYISLLVLEIQRLRNEIGELKLEINKKS